MTQNEFGDWVEDGNLDKSDMWDFVDKLFEKVPQSDGTYTLKERKTDISNKEV